VERRQSCASRLRRGRARQARQNTHCVCRRFPSDIFSFVLSRSSLPDLIRQSMPQLSLPSASHRAFACSNSAWTTGIGDRRTPFCERLCAVVTSQRVAWHSSDAQPHRENEILFSPLPVGERSRAKRAGEGDRDFDFKLRTPSPQPSPHRGEGEENASRERESIPLPPTRAARGGEGLGGTFLVRPPPRLISLT